MKCTRICTKDTLFIHNAVSNVKKILELEVEIQCNKYKYINAPSGIKLLIEGNKIYNICYKGDTKQNQVVGKTFKVPFCSIIPISCRGYGYKSIEFIVKDLRVLEVNQLGVAVIISYNIVCEEIYKQLDVETMNSQVMEVKNSKSAITYGLERKNNNNKLLGYLIYGNVQAVQLLIMSIVIYAYLNQNKLS